MRARIETHRESATANDERLRCRDVAIGEFLADVARTRVEHQPNEVLRVETNFDEVVTATERAELLRRFRFAIAHASVHMPMKIRYAKKQMKAARTLSRTHFETHFSRGWRSLGLSQSTEIVIRLKAPAFISRKIGTSIVKKQKERALSLPGKLPAPYNPREFFRWNWERESAPAD